MIVKELMQYLKNYPEESDVKIYKRKNYKTKMYTIDQVFKDGENIALLTQVKEK